MKNEVTVRWKEGMAFEAEVNTHKIMMDLNEEDGGQDLGSRPKAMVLGALGGCTGMDVVAILKKMKVEVKGFRMEIEAEVSEEHPKVYTKIHIKYIFTGNDLPFEKLEKAASLSEERYCSVAAMLKKGTDVTFSVHVE